MNIFKTFVLMALLTGLMVAIGGAVGDSIGAMIMLVIAIGMNFASYWFSDSIVLKSYNAREVTQTDAPQLWGIVERLANKAELPMPRVYVIDSDVPNAFATGRNPDNAAVAVTTGIMRALDENEISGVLGHELAHVKHRDILIGTIAASMAGVIHFLGRRYRAMGRDFRQSFGRRQRRDCRLPRHGDCRTDCRHVNSACRLSFARI